MSEKAKSYLVITGLVLTSILVMDFWWGHAFGVKEGSFYTFTKFTFVGVFVLLYNLSWGVINGIVTIFKGIFSIFSKKDPKETDERTGGSAAILLGMALGFVWGILAAIFSEHVSLFNGFWKMSQIGLIYGIIFYILIRMRIVLFSEGLAEVAGSAILGEEFDGGDDDYISSNDDDDQKQRSKKKQATPPPSPQPAPPKFNQGTGEQPKP